MLFKDALPGGLYRVIKHSSLPEIQNSIVLCIKNGADNRRIMIPISNGVFKYTSINTQKDMTINFDAPSLQAEVEFIAMIPEIN